MIAGYSERLEKSRRIAWQAGMIARADTKRPAQSDLATTRAKPKAQSPDQIAAAMRSWAGATRHLGNQKK